MIAVLAILHALQTPPLEPPGRFAFRSYGSEQGLENLSILAIVQDREGFLAAPGWPPGLGATAVWADERGIVAAAQGAVYTQHSGQWRNYPAAPERIDAVVRDHKGAVWARSARHLWALFEGHERLEDFSRLLPGGSDTGYLTLDPQGTLWVPTDAGLLYREDDEWKVLGPGEGLPASWARVATQDREGSVWIGVTGLHRLVGRGLWRVYSTRDGLPSEVVWKEWRDARGTLYVGTDRGVARAVDGRFELLPGTEEHAVRALAQMPDGAIWMGGSPPELLRLQNGRVERFGAEAGVTGRKILALLATRRGELLVGTDGGGLLRLEGKKFVPVSIAGGSVQERFSHVIEDGKGNTWAARELGLGVA